MVRLNYHHLHYFWTVARAGGITRASRELRVSKPTISSQLRQLELVLGRDLFEKRGREIALTEAGRLAFEYANRIFGLGEEMVQVFRHDAEPFSQKLVVGVADILPKAVVGKLLEPALKLDPPVRIVCREDRRVEEFVAELGLHTLDIVLSDSPLSPGLGLRAFSHLLGECGTTVFATGRLGKLQGAFPRSLEGAPCLMPGAHSVLRRAVDEWLRVERIAPRIVAEFDDGALMNVFGQNGAGFFFGPSVLEREIEQLYRVRAVGAISALRQRFYAITGERRIKHPAALAITQSARKDLFS